MKGCHRVRSYQFSSMLLVAVSLSIIGSTHIFAQIEDSFTLGTVIFDKELYEITEIATVTVIDEDMDFDEDVANVVVIDVWSDTDPVGIRLDLVETATSSGTFTATLSFTISDSSSGQRLRVSEEDYITAKYVDHTSDDFETVTVISQIASGTTEPTQTIKLQNIGIVDSFRNPIERVYTNNQVMVSADITSLTEKEQNYYFVLRVKDNTGKIVAASEWKDVPLRPFQTLNNAISWIPTESGTYTATIFILDKFPDGVNLADPLAIVVIVAQLEPENRLPIAKISATPHPVEEDDPIEFSASDSYDPDGTILTYNWNFGDGTLATGQNVNHIYEQNGKYSVILTVTDNKQAESTAGLVVIVEIKNQIPVAKIDGPNSAQVESELTLTALGSYDPDGGNIKLYEWDMGDGNIRVGQQITYSYSSPDQYFIRLTVTDDENSESQTTFPIKIEPRIPIEVIVGGGGVGAVAGTVVALTQIPKPIPKPSAPPNMTLSVRIRTPRVEIG